MTLKKDRLFTGIALMVIGILFLAAPVSSSLVIATVIGVILILEGLVRGYTELKKKEKDISTKAILLWAAVLIVVGIILLANPGYLVAYSYIIFGIVLILNAISNIIGVMRGEIQAEGNKFIYLILSAVLAIVGVIMLFNPFSAANMMMRIIGGMLIADGIVNLLIAWKMRA